jgi:hypothetical protein
MCDGVCDTFVVLRTISEAERWSSALIESTYEFKCYASSISTSNGDVEEDSAALGCFGAHFDGGKGPQTTVFLGG